MLKKTSSCGATASQETLRGQVEQTFPLGVSLIQRTATRIQQLSKTGLLKPYERVWLLNPASRNRVRERLTLGKPGCCNPYLINKPSAMHLRNVTAKPTWILSSDQNRFWPPYRNVKTLLWMWPATLGLPAFPAVSSVSRSPWARWPPGPAPAGGAGIAASAGENVPLVPSGPGGLKVVSIKPGWNFYLLFFSWTYLTQMQLSRNLRPLQISGF